MVMYQSYSSKVKINNGKVRLNNLCGKILGKEYYPIYRETKELGKEIILIPSKSISEDFFLEIKNQGKLYNKRRVHKNGEIKLPNELSFNGVGIFYTGAITKNKYVVISNQELNLNNLTDEEKLKYNSKFKELFLN